MLQPEQPRLYRMPLRLQLLAGIGCLLSLVYALQFPLRDCLRIVAVGITISGGATLLGVLFGFIFCYPRVKRAQEAAATQADIAVEDNSSLADISDWLTKIIVGVGLVELNKIPPALQRFSQFLSPGLEAVTPAKGSGQVLALALLLYFFPLGFMFGFIWTRFYYQEALKGLLDKIRVLEKGKSASDLADQAEAKLAEGRVDLAMADVEQALSLDKQNAKAMFVKALILKRQARPDPSRAYDRTLLEKALKYVTAVSKLLPGRASPLYNMGCYQALLQYPVKDVAATMRRAFTITPELARVADKDDDLKEARKNPILQSVIDEFMAKSAPKPTDGENLQDNPQNQKSV